MATLDQVVDAIIAEAIGEGDDGMAAVAWTMQNRANERGKSITDVVNGRTYTGLSDPGPAARRAQRNPAIRAKVEGILNAVQTGAYPDPTGGATHYWAPRGMPGRKDPYWADEEASRHGQYRIGNHVFLPKREPARIPPGYINEVATLTDTVRKPPAPLAPSPRTAALRQMTSPTGGNADLVNYVNQAARTKARQVTPASQSLHVGTQRALAGVRVPSDLQTALAGLAGNKAAAARTPQQVAMDALRKAPMGTPDVASLYRGITPQGRQNLLIEGGEIDKSVRSAAAAQPKSLLDALTRSIAPSRPISEVAAIYRNGGPTQPAKATTASVAKAPRTVAETAAIYRNGGPTRPATAPTTAPSGLITTSMARVANKTDSALQAALEGRVRTAAAAPSPAQRSIAEVAGIYRQGGPTQPNPASAATPRGGSSVLADYAYNTSLKAAPQINANAPVRLAPNAPGVGNMPGGKGLTPYQVASIGVDVNGRKGGVAPTPAPASQRPAQPQVATQLSVVRPTAAPARVMLPALPPSAPAKPAAPAAPTTRTVMREQRVENPAYKTWQASQTAKVNTVPLGMQTNMGSRDSVVQAAKAKAELAAAPTPPPARYITRQVPVKVTVPAPAVKPVAPKPAPMAPVAPRVQAAAPPRAPLNILVEGANIVQPKVAPVPFSRPAPAPASILSGRMSLPQMMSTPGVDPNRIARQMAFQQAASSASSLSEQAGGSAFDEAQGALMAARAKAIEDEQQAKRDAFFAKHGKAWI